MPKNKSNNVQGNLSAETKGLLRQSGAKVRAAQNNDKSFWARWRQAYASRVGGREFDDVEPSAANKKVDAG